jgi:hypothetical protein
MTLSHAHETAGSARPSRFANPKFHALIASLGMALALCALGCSRNHRLEQGAATNSTSESQPQFGGETWLKWDKSSRMAFVMGNLRGYWDGTGAGCFEAQLEVESLKQVSGFTSDVAREMQIHCASKFKLSARTFESYEEVTSKFYMEYPEQRTVEIQDVLLMLASDSKLTADDVHKRINITHSVS